MSPLLPAPAPELRSSLLAWFARAARPLPWRDGYDPYQVWVAEVMGQQTQMDRVVDYFQRWMARFPGIEDLARADEQEVLRLWEGLGYYGRARKLLEAARQVVERHQGRLPRDRAALLALPGIGPYTAAAILSMAFSQPVPLKDANVERVLARLMDLDLRLDRAPGRRRVDRAVAALFSPDHPRDHNQALMELGALVCTPRAPACVRCPWRAWCLARVRGTVLERPPRRPRPGTVRIEMACGILLHQGRILIQQRLPDDVWGALWEFPGGRLKPGESPEAAARREFLEETGLLLSRLRPLASVAHHFTRYRVELHGFFCRAADQPPRPRLLAASQNRWVRPAELERFAFPAGHRMLIEAMTGAARGSGDSGAANRGTAPPSPRVRAA